MIQEKNIPTTLNLNPSVLDGFLSHKAKEGRDDATVMIAGLPCDREDLPDSVALSEEEFMDGLRKQGLVGGAVLAAGAEGLMAGRLLAAAHGLLLERSLLGGLESCLLGGIES